MQANLLETLFKIESEAFTKNSIMFNLDGNRQADVDRQLSVLLSEVNELRRSFETGDIIEFFDGIGDVVYVLGSLWHMNNGTLPDAAQVHTAIFTLATAVHTVKKEDLLPFLTQCTQIAMVNNLTKFDTNIEDATLTKMKYESKGIPTQIVELAPDMFIVKSLITDEDLDVVENKVLKSVVRHTKPDFSVVVVPAGLQIPAPLV